MRASKGAPRVEKNPMISGLSHITFITRHLDKMSRIIIDVLGGKEIYDSAAKNFSISHEKFFMVGDLWVVAMEGERLPSRSYNHIAFKTDEAALEKAKRAIEKLGLEVKPSRPRVEGEGHSLYFYTYDNHLIELHTGTLQERLKRYNEGKV